MSAPRMANQLTPERLETFRVWWRSEHGRLTKPEHAPLLAEYLTPEQQADFAEFGAFCFVTERGDVKHTFALGHNAGRCLRPYVGPPEGIPWMLAVKLVWQADQAGVERVMGQEGWTLP